MVWAVLLWILLALLAAVVALLCLPVKLRLDARSEPVRAARLELGLLGGWVPWIALVDTARPRKRKAKAKKRKKKEKHKKKRAGKGGGAWLWRGLPGLLRGLLRPVRLERFELDCAFGLGDPAETGQLYGMLAPLYYGTAGVRGPRTRITLVPDFERARLEGRADVVLSVVPARWLPPLVRFGWAAWGPGK